MTEVYWLEQTETDLPATNEWLNDSEAARLHSMRFERRQRSWRLGRWTAKLAVLAYQNMSARLQTLREIEIRPAASGAPDVFFGGQPAPVTISLSHRDGTAVCAVAPANIALGCDIEVIEPRSEAFTADYFTAEEQDLVAEASKNDQSRLLALLWSGKESALKALREGLRLDTRSVVVHLDELEGVVKGFESLADSSLAVANSWLRLHVSRTSGEVFPGWWQMSEKFVRTTVAVPAPYPPILLQVHSAAPVR